MTPSFTQALKPETDSYSSHPELPYSLYHLQKHLFNSSHSFYQQSPPPQSIQSHLGLPQKSPYMQSSSSQCAILCPWLKPTTASQQPQNKDQNPTMAYMDLHSLAPKPFSTPFSLLSVLFKPLLQSSHMLFLKPTCFSSAPTHLCLADSFIL